MKKKVCFLMAAGVLAAAVIGCLTGPAPTGNAAGGQTGKDKEKSKENVTHSLPPRKPSATEAEKAARSVPQF